MSYFEPEAVLGVTKYGPNGLFSLSSFDSFQLSAKHKNLLKTAANLSKKSWSAYKTVEKMLHKSQEETGAIMQLPLTDKNVLLFLAWLMERDYTRGQ